MPSPLDKIKPEVRAIKAYTLPPLKAAIKINQNENPHDLPGEIKAEVFRRLEQRAWSRYPTFVPHELHEKLAQHAGWIPEGVLAGNGSNELIQACLTVCVGAGTKVLIPEPTFTLYRQLATILGGEVTGVPLSDRLQFHIARLASKVAIVKPDVMIICSPNNPTGCAISTRDLRLLLKGTDGLIIVDQAYVEFGGEDFVPLLREFPNLIILRTFSKAMAMAGLRIGYLLASPELVTEINKAKLPYNMSFFSIAAAEVAIERYSLLRPLIEQIKSERERVLAELRKIPGIVAVPSEGNFFLLRSPLPPSELFERLHTRGILIRDVSKYPMLSDFVRISVGSHGENERLLFELQELFGKS
jgi:histidinol-phosphate aminotransferase